MLFTSNYRVQKSGTTILELMIAIAVIVILAGLAMVAVTSTSQMSSTQETKNVIMAMLTLEKEHAAQYNKTVDDFVELWGAEQDIPAGEWKDKLPSGQNKSGVVQDTSERVIYLLLLDPQLKGYLEKKGMEKFLDDFNANGFPELKDAWGKEIRYTRKSIFFDTDGTKDSTSIPDEDDVILHRPVNQNRYYVSAGADGFFGDEDPNSEESGWTLEDRIRLAKKHAEDNITNLNN